MHLSSGQEKAIQRSTYHQFTRCLKRTRVETQNVKMILAQRAQLMGVVDSRPSCCRNGIRGRGTARGKQRGGGGPRRHVASVVPRWAQMCLRNGRSLAMPWSQSCCRIWPPRAADQLAVLVQLCLSVCLSRYVSSLLPTYCFIGAISNKHVCAPK